MKQKEQVRREYDVLTPKSSLQAATSVMVNLTVGHTTFSYLIRFILDKVSISAH